MRCGVVRIQFQRKRAEGEPAADEVACVRSDSRSCFPLFWKFHQLAILPTRLQQLAHHDVLLSPPLFQADIFRPTPIAKLPCWNQINTRRIRASKLEYSIQYVRLCDDCASLRASSLSLATSRLFPKLVVPDALHSNHPTKRRRDGRYPECA